MSLGLAVLGSTGSVGRSVLRVVREHPDRLKVVALAAFGGDVERLLRQAQLVRPSVVAVVDSEAAARIAKRLPPGTELVAGPDAASQVVTAAGVNRVVAAIVGAAGLRPVHAALAAGRDVALANKESLVVAGQLLLRLASRTGATMLPIDSEHVALHQVLRAGRKDEVRRLVLTASGGPFWRRDVATFGAIDPDEALEHPTWKMGAKITIDSATLMNKGLELIEASHLFAVPQERLDVVIHPQSIVHSFVEYLDGSWLAQLSVNDMVFPVQYALSFPERWSNEFPRLDLHQLGRLDFHPVDTAKFPAVGLARAALEAGESAPAVLNAANEVAVHAFLGGELPFPAISVVVEEVLSAHRAEPVDDLEAALAWDEWARRRARETVARHRRKV